LPFARQAANSDNWTPSLTEEERSPNRAGSLTGCPPDFFQGGAGRKEIKRNTALPDLSWSRRPFEKNHESADGRDFVVAEVLERYQAETVRETFDFAPGQRPGHFPFGLMLLARSRDEEQLSALPDEICGALDSLLAQIGRKNLQGVGFQNEIETARPFAWRVQQIRDDIIDAGLREAPLAGANCGIGYVERGRRKSPSCKLLRVVAETASDIESRLAGSCDRLTFPEIQQARVWPKIGPRDGALALIGFAIQPLEPSERIAPGDVLGGELSGARAVRHRLTLAGWEPGANRRVTSVSRAAFHLRKCYSPLRDSSKGHREKAGAENTTGRWGRCSPRDHVRLPLRKRRLESRASATAGGERKAKVG
jgi:hypothetical protein